jgi:hypothetical protein
MSEGMSIDFSVMDAEGRVMEFTPPGIPALLSEATTRAQRLHHAQERVSIEIGATLAH